MHSASEAKNSTSFLIYNYFSAALHLRKEEILQTKTLLNTHDHFMRPWECQRGGKT